MKKYCFQCGSKIDFSVKNKPKFCFNCGTVLEPSLVAKGSSPILDNDNDDDDYDESPSSIDHINISELDFEFDKDSLKTPKQTIGSVMGTLDKSEIDQLKDFPQRPKTSSKKFKEEFKKEAGSLKQNKPTEEDAPQ